MAGVTARSIGMHHRVVLDRASEVPHPRGRAQHWHTADDDLRAFVDGIVAELANVLGDRLIAVTLHGSLAAGCFYRAKSHVDLLWPWSNAG
jgi:streptomycin 3"-adenylyltransferase